ncbi:MAG TPA: BREX system P-loop protein BrxC, partial [Anaerolineae bacterium]|nr:BREX system P-loop protein BrxC [Anaerolineae bacterium]
MAVYLRDLFVYPIDRYIPPVVKVDDVTEATVEMELREYVVTTPIERALANFLEVYAESRTVPTDKIGVWISGFFGSGKSLFAKMLSYLLTNPTVRGRPARELFLERLAGSPHRAEIEALLHRVGMLDSRVIMFNIKTEQNQQTRDESISEIMYRRYLAHRDLSTDPVVASLELSLIRRGLYDAFRAEVERRTGRAWTEEREDFLFVRPIVAEALQAVAPEAYRSREEALAALDLVKGGQRLAVSDLVQRLVEYVDELAEAGNPERPPRLVFIMDEVGQFIGTNEDRLLELQSIAETFGTLGRGKLWLIVTAQARLHEIIAGVEAKDADFGKIGARFDTRLALSTEDVEKVLEGRILKKKEERIPEIRSFYHDHEGTLAALSVLPGASRDLPGMTAERFIATTPFLPYHPALIQAIFANVQSATGFGLNPEVRSMIAMAQGILSDPDNGFVQGELGRIVALDMVYDQIAVDLQPQDRREIDNLPKRLPSYRELDQRVLKALYLLQAVPWIAVTAETLAHALPQDVRTEDVGRLKADVEESLKRLHKARYVVPKEDGVWEFLTGAKKSFEEEVANVNVRQVDQRRAVRKALAEVLRPVGRLNYRDGLRTFDVTVRGDGEELLAGGEITLEVYSPLYVELEGITVEDLEQIKSFAHSDTVYWVAAESPDLVNLLTRAIRLDTVLEKWLAKPSKTDEEREIIREKERELSILHAKIKRALRGALVNGTIVWNGRAEELDGRVSTLNPIFNRYVGRVIPYVYPKFDLAAIKPNEEDIKAVLTMAPFALATVGAGLDLFDKEGHLNQHSAVVEEVRQELERRSHHGGSMSGKALEEHFTGGDYGWHPVVVRLVLAAMFRAGMVSVKADNVHYTNYAVPAAQVLFTKVRPFRRAVFFYEAAEAVTPDELRKAQDELKVIFDAPRREETANTLAEQIRSEMEEWNKRADRVVLQLRSAEYPVPEALQRGQALFFRVTRFANPSKVVKAFLENLDEVRAWHAEVQILYAFIRDKKLPIFERGRRLLEEIRRAEGIPGAEPLAEEDANGWRETLQTLV